MNTDNSSASTGRESSHCGGCASCSNTSCPRRQDTGSLGELLERSAVMCTEDALARMGDVDNGCDKRAHSHVHIKGCACQHDENGDCKRTSATDLDVCVRMAVKNSGDNGGDNIGGGCDGNCDDGCCPPRPPVPPAPAPTGRSDDWWLGVVTIFLGFLAFLVVVGAIVALCWFHPWTIKVVEKPHNPPVVVVCPGCNNQPSVQPTPSDPVTPPSVIPPQQPPVQKPVTCPAAGTYRSPNPPEFTLPYLHNLVRQRATEYVVTYQPNCGGAVMEAWLGTGNDRLLLNVQEYGAGLAFCRQYIINYSQTGNELWVDLFTAPNLFVGRTLYEFNGSGSLVQIRLFDGHQKMQSRLVVNRDASGAITRIYRETYNQFGTVVDVQNYYSLGEALAGADYYLANRILR